MKKNYFSPSSIILILMITLFINCRQNLNHVANKVFKNEKNIPKTKSLNHQATANNLPVNKQVKKVFQNEKDAQSPNLTSQSPIHKEELEDGIEEAMKLEFMKTQDPALHRIPNERLQIASKQMDAMMLSNAQFRTSALSWTERGPNNIGGRTRAILVDRNDATNNTVFAGSVGGGIWKCTGFTTAGYNWSKVNDNMENLAITVLAQDPTALNIMYAGTGEGFNNVDAIRGGGIFKSTDGGANWSVLGSTQPPGVSDFNFVQDIAVTSTGIVYASARSASFCTSGGVFKSINKGISWTRVIGSYNNSGNCADALNFNGNKIRIASNGDLYATTGLSSTGPNNYGRIFKSAAALGAVQGDAGQWTDITPTPPAGDPGFQRIEIAIAQSNNQVLYALCQAHNSSAIRRLYMSKNGGTSWLEIVPPSWCDQGTPGPDFTRGQAFYDLVCAIDPNVPAKVYIGGVDIMNSFDTGKTFDNLTQWASGCVKPVIHADQQNMIFLPASPTTFSSTNFIATNDGGIYYTNDGGASFTAKNSGYNVTQYYSVAIHPTNANYFLGGSQDNGSHKFITAGVNTVTEVSGGDGAFAFIGQANPLIQISSYTNSNYYISRDGGNTFPFTTNSGKGLFINPSDYDERAAILYRADDNGVLGRVTNIMSGTPTLTSVAIAELGANQISAIKVDPNAGNTIWVSGNSDGIVLKIVNPQTASPVVSTLSIPGVTGYISSIDVEKGNSNHVLATISNYGVQKIWESINGGTLWTDITGNLPDMPVRWGIFLPSGSTEGVIAIATELGVFTTTATSGGTTTWIPNNTGFPKVRTDMLKYRRSDNTLIAATHGRGLFTSTLGISPITWVGTTNNNWATATNWSPNRVPTATDDVIIPTVAANMPVTVTGTQGFYNLTIQIGASVNVTGILQNSGSISNSGTLTASNGTIEMTGISAQSIAANSFGSNTIGNLKLSNIAVTNLGALNVTGTLSFGNISNGLFATSGLFTLKSNATTTARVGDLTNAGVNTGNAITGNVTVERYIPANANKAWRFLSVPTITTQTINAAWQNGQPSGVTGTPGTGTMITSNNGNASFDFQTPGNSMLTYDVTANVWTGIPNTTSSIATDNGYMLFVRGDRTATPSNGLKTATTLSTVGTLKQGNYPAGTITTASNQFVAIGNPYASQIDFRNVTKTAGIDNTFYVWDPKLSSVGGYQTLTLSSGNYIINPGGGSYGGPGSVMNTIESGQAFFIRSSFPANFSFTEAAKTTGSNNSVFRTGTTPDKSLISNLYSVTSTGEELTDGTMSLFDNSYSNSINGMDVLKLTNFGLNFGLLIDNKILSVEKRQPVIENDIIQFSLTNAKQQQYRLEFIANGIAQAGLSAYLVDKYLQTSTPVDLSGTTSVPFTINADAGSSAENRFSIVFNKPSLLNVNSSIVIYPNPVQNGLVKVQMNNMPKGSYNVRLINSLGQTIMSKQIDHAAGSSIETVGVNKIKGSYILEITNPDKSKTVNKLIIN